MLKRVARLFAGNDIFLSYRWKDRNKEYGLRLTEELEKRGFACYIDEKGLSRGEFVTGALERAIRRSRMFVVLITDDIEESKWVPKEIAIASKRGRKIVPVNINGAMDKLSFDDERWSPLRDRSRVEESHEALERRSPSPHVVQQIDEAYQFTRQSVIATRTLFAVGAIFFGLSVAAVVSAVGAVQIRNSAELRIAELDARGRKLTTDIEKASQDKAKADRERQIAVTARDTARTEQQQAEAEAADQRRLAADQLKLKGYVTAANAGDKTAAFLNVRDFEADDRTNGWKDAAVAVLQNPLPIWQADERVIDLDNQVRRMVVLTGDKTVLVRELDRPGTPIRLGGEGPVLADGVHFGTTEVGWSADGNFVRVFLAGRLGVWDTRHPQKPVLLVDHGFQSVFSPEGSELAVVNERGVAFWNLNRAVPVNEGEQAIKGVIWGFNWIKGRRGPYCQVRNDQGVGESGLFEVWAKGQTRLESGRLLEDYELTRLGEIVTKTEHRGPQPTTNYAIRARPESKDPDFVMTVPGVTGGLDFGLTLAGRHDRFLVAGMGNTLWLGDRENREATPAVIATDLRQESNKQEIRPLGKDRIAVAFEGGKKFRLFDLAHPAGPKVFEGDLADISPDGHWLVNSDGILDLESEKWFAFPGHEPMQQYKTERVVFSPDSKLAAVLLRTLPNNALRLLIIDPEHPTRLETVDQPGTKPTVIWSNVKQKEFITSGEGLTRLWRLSAEPKIKVGEKTFQFPKAVSSSGDFVWMEDGGWGRWNIESWRASGSRETAIAMTVLPDSLAVNVQQTQAVAAVGMNGGMRFVAWTLNGSAPAKPIKTPDRSFEFVSASRDSLRVLTIGKNERPALWAAPFDGPIAQISAAGDFYKGSLSNSGNAAALFGLGAMNADSVEAWNLSNPGRPSKIAHYRVRSFDNETFQAAISDDGRRVATFGAGNAYLFSKEHPNGQRLNGSDNGVRSLEFSPSGKRLLATLYSGEAVVWQCEKPDRPELVMSGFSSMLGLSRFGKSDDEIVTVTTAGEVQRWNVSAKGLRAELNRRAPLCMTPTETRLYLGLSPGYAGLSVSGEQAKRAATTSVRASLK